VRPISGSPGGRGSLSRRLLDRLRPRPGLRATGRRPVRLHSV